MSAVHFARVPSYWLKREHSGLSLARCILDELVASGRLTLDEIKTACEKVLQKD